MGVRLRVNRVVNRATVIQNHCKGLFFHFKQEWITWVTISKETIQQHIVNVNQKLQTTIYMSVTFWTVRREEFHMKKIFEGRLCEMQYIINILIKNQNKFELLTLAQPLKHFHKLFTGKGINYIYTRIIMSLKLACHKTWMDTKI